MEQSSMVFQKDGKNYLQLDCENAKELSMKLGEKTYPFTKDGKKWILELPFSTAVNYVQICVDGQEVLLPELPIGHGYCHLYNYIELPDGNELTEIRIFHMEHWYTNFICQIFPITGNGLLFIFRHVYRLRGFLSCICSMDSVRVRFPGQQQGKQISYLII